MSNTTDQLIKVTYPTAEGPERFGHKPVLDDGSFLSVYKCVPLQLTFETFGGKYSEDSELHIRVTHHSSRASR